MAYGYYGPDGEFVDAGPKWTCAHCGEPSGEYGHLVRGQWACRRTPVDLSKVPKAHLVIPHDDFDATMLSNDCKTYFVDGFGLLEIRGNSMDGVVLEYHDHCGDGKLLPEWDRSKPAQADG